MIWVQGLLSFAVWLFVGWAVFRQFGRNAAKPPASRICGPLVMLAGGAIMIFGMVGIGQAGGLEDGRLTTLGWIGSTVVGAVFIAFQTFGAVLVTNALAKQETPPPADASHSSEDS